MRFPLFATLLLSIAAPAVAQDATSPAQPAKPKKEKKVCKRFDATSGSHMPTVVCHTSAEWAAQGDTVAPVMRPGMISGNRDDAH